MLPDDHGQPRETAATATALRLLYEDELRHFVARRVRNRHDADDISQQTMLQALLGLAGFRGSNLRAWVFTIARNVIADRMRREGRSIVVSPDELDVDDRSAPFSSIPEICECRERLQHCLTCFERQIGLPEQISLLLADVHGLRDKDSAARMKMPVTSFKWLLFQARSSMHEFAGGTCPLVGKAGMNAPCEGAPGLRKRTRPEIPVHRRAPSPCGLSDDELRTLRRELLTNLGM